MRLLCLFFCAVSLLLAGCGDGEADSTVPVTQVVADPLEPPYRFGVPDARFELPGRLDEISALTVLDDRHLGTVQDEKGILYVLDVTTGEVVHQHKFGKHGDYEGAEFVAGSVVVLRSDGRLYVIDDWMADSSDARHVDTGLHEGCDAEGLAFDPTSTRLFIACKEKPGHGYRGSRTIFALDPTTNRLDATPAFVIRADSVTTENTVDATVRSIVGPLADLSAFKPSALAVHPRTDEIYVLSSVRKEIVVLDRTGAIAAVWPLSKDLLRQPEGLAFLPDGTLFISSEARGGTPVLLRFDYLSRTP